MRDKFLPDEIYISSGSDDKDNLMSLQKLLEEIRLLSGCFFRCSRNPKIGVLEQFEDTSRYLLF